MAVEEPKTRIDLTQGHTAHIFTFDLDFQSQVGCGTHAKGQGQRSLGSKASLVQKLDWKQMDGRTDGGDYITRLTNAVGKSMGRKLWLGLCSMNSLGHI